MYGEGDAPPKYLCTNLSHCVVLQTLGNSCLNLIHAFTEVSSYFS